MTTSKLLRELCGEAELECLGYTRPGMPYTSFCIYTLEAQPLDVILDLLKTFLDQDFDSLEDREDVLYELTDDLHGAVVVPADARHARRGAYVIWQDIPWAFEGDKKGLC